MLMASMRVRSIQIKDIQLSALLTQIYQVRGLRVKALAARTLVRMGFAYIS